MDKQRTDGYSYSGVYREHKDTVTQGFTENTRIELLRGTQRTQVYRKYFTQIFTILF